MIKSRLIYKGDERHHSLIIWPCHLPGVVLISQPVEKSLSPEQKSLFMRILYVLSIINPALLEYTTNYFFVYLSYSRARLSIENSLRSKEVFTSWELSVSEVISPDRSILGSDKQV